MQISNNVLYGCFLGIAIFLSFLCIVFSPLPSLQELRQSQDTLAQLHAKETHVLGPCAVNLYGLPRSFKDSVLPSLIQNVIQPNRLYQCDYFVHFDNLQYEKPNGRNDRVGQINPSEVYLLTEAVKSEYTRIGLEPARVIYSNTTALEFQQKYKGLLEKIFSEIDEQGNPIYLPFNHKSYTNGTIENVIKMWHSQESVWNLMESQTDKHYSRVAMLRSDVVYVTPIDVYELGTPPNSRAMPTTKQLDYDNVAAVIPNFARFPVNDRMIYGPYDAIKLWAAGRFGRLHQHIAHVQKHARGDGLHSERFLQYTIFPAIRQTGVTIQTKKGLCFLRVRADHSIRFSDCGKIHVTENNHDAVENILGRTCFQNWALDAKKKLVQLECPLRGKALLIANPAIRWQ